MQHPHAGPTSEEEFDLDVPDEDNYEQEHDVLPVRSNPVTENRTEPVTPPMPTAGVLKRLAHTNFSLGRRTQAAQRNECAHSARTYFRPF